MESGMIAFRIRFTATATPLAPPPTIAIDTAFAPKPAPISDELEVIFLRNLPIFSPLTK
jgi:hypothetical protein